MRRATSVAIGAPVGNGAADCGGVRRQLRTEMSLEPDLGSCVGEARKRRCEQQERERHDREESATPRRAIVPGAIDPWAALASAICSTGCVTLASRCPSRRPGGATAWRVSRCRSRPPAVPGDPPRAGDARAPVATPVGPCPAYFVDAGRERWRSSARPSTIGSTSWSPESGRLERDELRGPRTWSSWSARLWSWCRESWLASSRWAGSWVCRRWRAAVVAAADRQALRSSRGTGRPSSWSSSTASAAGHRCSRDGLQTGARSGSGT